MDRKLPLKQQRPGKASRKGNCLTQEKNKMKITQHYLPEETHLLIHPQEISI
jgi:hypothetical protein